MILPSPIFLSFFCPNCLTQVATSWEERLAEVGRRVKMARANLNGLLYQGEEEGRVLGVLEVQEEARRIERLWERSFFLQP